MKIAIMTQPLGKNYGGIMQAWALQQVLKRLGHEPVTIDRQPDTSGPAYHAARLGYRALKKAIGKRKAPSNFELHPAIKQLGLVQPAGIGLAWLNSFGRALMGKGLVKRQNIQENKNKAKHHARLPRRWIAAKAEITTRVFKRKKCRERLPAAEDICTRGRGQNWGQVGARRQVRTPFIRTRTSLPQECLVSCEQQVHFHYILGR